MSKFLILVFILASALVFAWFTGLGRYCHYGLDGSTHCHWIWEAEHIH